MSKWRAIILAAKAMIGEVHPYATLHGFDKAGKKPTRPSPGGDIYGFADDVKEEAVMLSPLTYHLIGTLYIQIAPYGDSSDDLKITDEMAGLIGARVISERVGARLGGLVDWIEARPAQIEEESIPGAEALIWSSFALEFSFCTSDPLN